ncbi:tetraacyldisaccharide 4'-kinase [Marinomonas sp. 2405UD66-6]|uniref:tetraacyldisaccharide 4'-kinase n=1 Tax=Marinomonas sp. 2405UD66-6 TaxID=3391834 RepID=UPI0039C90AF6
MSLERLINRSWYGKCGWTHIFQPVQPLVKKLVKQKRTDFLQQTNPSYRAPVPVIVIGNISVGGTGKSPMVVAICELLKKQGYRPGIVSRGHGAKVDAPTTVSPDSFASAVGDEPVMLARQTHCPLVVFPKRDQAVQHLLKTTDVNIIISDDGMQHYQLDRDIEIAMLDAKRGVGNSQLLPVGPLREPVERLTEVDFIVSISEQMTDPLTKLNLPVVLTRLTSSSLLSLDGLRSLDSNAAFTDDEQWHVMAGIGNPQRFLDTLTELGLAENNTTHKWFSDHHSFKESDIPETGNVVMTEKDAVKCQSLASLNPNLWYLPVSLVLPESFQHDFLEKLNLIKVGNQDE